ncbi:protein disulfide isomerase [Paramecium bursaria Chlorella virus NYs1]|uniref:Protein disulfide isomerase n=1 Tax=Paramecium bursaria Chlorella virus NYs1 TaxID=83442 RepID=M1HHN0_9PHYC|nr:protein disulfide isomerase [Paramecium bursaria Chlorella virus NYs1]AGE58818.1 protein disulfide isomerase [Paramecium bursaria Chlorella virus NYs1]
MSREHESFRGFVPFRRDIQLPSVLFCKWNQCGHCHELAPQMKRVQTILKDEMPVYVVDAEKNNKIIKALKVNGFPEIIVVGTNRRVHKFKGTREPSKIVQFIRQNK